MARKGRVPDIPKPSLEEFEDAAVRPNTRKSYEGDVRHYRDEFCGLLPALPNHLRDYLYEYSDKLSPDTLSRRLAGIAAWHTEHGYPDYTKHDSVRKVLRGIRHYYGRPPEKAYPLVLDDISRIVEYLDFSLAKPFTAKDNISFSENLRLHRDKALITYMFWRGLRAHQAVMLEPNLINTNLSGKWEITFQPDKTHDDYYQLDLYEVTKKSIQHLCPIRALENYINVAQINEGPIFCRIFYGGDLAEEAMHPNSLNPWIKTLADDAGVGPAADYSISSHSPRTGFATSFADKLGPKRLMEYMGWKSERVALGYIQAIDQDAAMKSITTDQPPTPGLEHQRISDITGTDK